MSKIIDELRKKLDSMSQEELDAEWEKLKHYNDCGPTVDEYVNWVNTAAKNKVEIAEKEIHEMELNGTWVNDKPRYRMLKKVAKYWKDYLNENNED